MGNGNGHKVRLVAVIGLSLATVAGIVGIVAVAAIGAAPDQFLYAFTGACSGGLIAFSSASPPNSDGKKE